jgi:hypothetical protein
MRRQKRWGNCYGQELKSESLVWISEADEGYASGAQQRQAGCTCILMDPKWVCRVSDYYTLGGNRVQVLKLKVLPCGDSGFRNVYAPNSPAQRVSLWELLKEKFQGNAAWFFAGTGTWLS